MLTLMLVIYFWCFPSSLLALEYAIRGGGNRTFCRTVQFVLFMLAVASAAALIEAKT